MCNIKNLTVADCLTNPAGVKAIGYVVPAGEITSMPPFLTTTGAGDTVRSTVAFDFTGQAAGKGFFRVFNGLPEKGNYTFSMVGPQGSKTIEEKYTFVLKGVDAPQLEFVQSLATVPCVFIAPDKKGVLHVIGSKDDPAYIESVEGGTGTAASDERIITITVRATTANFHIHEAAIDVTPNV